MIDLLTFKSFISSEVLIFFYYLFAIGIPILLYLFKKKILEIAIIQKNYSDLKDITWDQLTQKQKLKLIGLFVFCFVMCELFLRMFFEFLIAYIQIRDVLVGA